MTIMHYDYHVPWPKTGPRSAVGVRDEGVYHSCIERFIRSGWTSCPSSPLHAARIMMYVKYTSRLVQVHIPYL